MLLQEVIPYLPHYVALKDKSHRYTTCNAAYAKLVGLADINDIKNKTDETLPSPRPKESWQQDQSVLTGTQSFYQQHEMWTRDKTPRYFLVDRILISSKPKAVEGLLYQAIDITEQHLLLNKDRERTHFLRTMSHDLRTPLNAILGLTEVLKMRSSYPDQSELIDTIIQAGRDMLRLVEKIGDVARNDM